jgi:hypothetical protein
MKKGKWIVFIICFSGAGFLQADTIRSVPGGGIWSVNSTWVGNVVPGKNDTVLVRGMVSLRDSAMCRQLTVADSAILQSDTSFAHVTLAVTGSIANNGTIRNNSTARELWLELYGDCMNNGKWTPARTFFVLKDTQTIAQSSESEFGGAFYMTNAAGVADHFPLVAASDLIINTETFNGIGRATSEEWQGALDMAGFSLTLAGGSKCTGIIMYNTTIVEIPDSASFSNCTFESNVMINGAFTVTDSKVYFNRNVTISGSGGILQNGETQDSVTIVHIKGNCMNFGNISNNPKGNKIWLELDSDIYNAGIWHPDRTYLTSRKKQTIGQIAQSSFEGNFFAFSVDSTSDTFPLVATSDLRFYGAEDFNVTKIIGGLAREGTFDMGWYDLYLLGGSYLNGATFLHTKKVTCRDTSMIGSSTFKDPVQACGRFQVAVQAVYFNDTLTVVDTLENGAGGCCIAQGILFALGGIVNKGLIRDNPVKYQLWCTIGKDVVNEGKWINTRNMLVDSVAQTVSLANGKPINSMVIFDGMWPTEPYGWQKDGQNLPNDTMRLLTLDSLDTSSVGVYRCKHGDAWSRAITVVWDTTSGVVRPGKRAQGAPVTFGCVVASGANPVLLFQAPYACAYTMSLYDIRGKRVSSASSAVSSSGYHSIAIPGKGLARGAYMLRFRAARFEKRIGVAIIH